MEEWRSVVGYEGHYEVSNEGRVRSLDRLVRVRNGGSGKKSHSIRGAMMRQGIWGKYPCVKVCKDGIERRLMVHRVVAEAFLGSIPENFVVNHLDGNKNNARAKNLEICTESRNMQHAYDTGLRKPVRGRALNRGTLVEADILDMRKRCADGETQASIAKSYGIRSSSVNNIIARRCWKHI